MLLLQDVRYAFRTLRRSLGLTLVIIASLAIGIGANTAIFSVVNALLLKPLPYPEPDRLAVLWLRSPGINIPQDWPSPGQYFDVVNENQSFEETSISQGRSGTLLGISGAGEPPANQEAQRVEGLLTSSSLFHMLGAKPFKGRLLRPDEDKPGQPAVAILSHGLCSGHLVVAGEVKLVIGQTKNRISSPYVRVDRAAAWSTAAAPLIREHNLLPIVRK